MSSHMSPSGIEWPRIPGIFIKCVINPIWETFINYSSIDVRRGLQRMTSLLAFNDLELLCTHDRINLVWLLDWIHFVDWLHNLSSMFHLNQQIAIPKRRYGQTYMYTSLGIFNLWLFVEYKKGRLSDWLDILASQSQSLHFFIPYEQAWVLHSAKFFVHCLYIFYLYFDNNCVLQKQYSLQDFLAVIWATI